MTTIDKNKAENIIKSINKEEVFNYIKYWKSISPKNEADIFKRYLFAFCSVHTTYKGNISGYNSIKHFNEWIFNKELLFQKLKRSGAGLYNNRTNYIWKFREQFWEDPHSFTLSGSENHENKRDSISDKISGLGLAKVSFALEMIHPISAKVVCGDIHQLRLYGIENLKYNKSKKGTLIYKDMERHWNATCESEGVPSYIARCIFWDAYQNKENSSYWSNVFET